MIGYGFLTINNSRMTVPQALVTEKQPPLTLTHLRRNNQCLNSPYVNVLHPKMTESQLPYVHYGYTFGYHRKKFIRTCWKSSAHDQDTEIRVGKFKNFKTSVRLAR